LMPLFDVEKAAQPGPSLIASVTIRVQEIPTINLGSNGTGKSAEQIAEQVAKKLHHLHAVGLYSPLYPAKDFITANRDYLPKITYDVRFLSMMPLAKLAKVAIPTITPSSGSAGTPVSLACSTGGASIYYTTDDSWPRNGNGTLYAAPFNAPNGPLRAAAYAAGFIGSDCARGEYD
jgi:hypothetical protein